jgi:hypothetical protein
VVSDSGQPPIDLRFVVDDWSTMGWPRFLKPFGFTHRFEVIQDTSVEGVDDLHLDRPLWRRLADYMALEGKHHRVLVVRDLGRSGLARPGIAATLAAMLPGAEARAVAAIEHHGLPLADFLADDDAAGGDDADWDPPDAIFILDERTVRLALTTDRYYLAGGESAAHHDSVTYAFHARRDLSGAAIAFLQLAPGAARWNFDMLVSLADGPG